MKILKKILVEILTLESRLIIKKYKPLIVAVTGSVGKTSTKDAIYNVLKDQSKFVRKSQKSMNSEIGLPLTIIGVPNAWHNLGGWIKNIGSGLELIFKNTPYPDCLILEIGADHPGDIKKVVKWLHPDIAVITKISRMPVHVEFFKTPEEVFEEKAALATAVKPGGTLILLADDEKVLSLGDRLKNKDVKIISYGIDEKAMVRGIPGEVIYESDSSPIGFSFNLNIEGGEFSIIVKKVIGNVYMYPLLASAAVGKARSLDSNLIAKLISEYEAPKGRMNIIPGINGSTLIDDTYNSSPDAVSAALEALKSLKTSGLKIAVLGDMMELGKYTVDEHRRIGREIPGVISKLVAVGRRSQSLADEAVRNGFSENAVKFFDNSNEAGDYLALEVKAGDIILVKGSQSMRMERVVSKLLRNPADAPLLLVRQEREWLEKK